MIFIGKYAKETQKHMKAPGIHALLLEMRIDTCDFITALVSVGGIESQ